jgi:hypothetical protein
MEAGRSGLPASASAVAAEHKIAREECYA